MELSTNVDQAQTVWRSFFPVPRTSATSYFERMWDPSLFVTSLIHTHLVMMTNSFSRRIMMSHPFAKREIGLLTTARIVFFLQ